ncbi:hypothetical protein Tco_0271332, partial [Tanacetum coccineum]
MEQMTTLRDLVGQAIQKKEEEQAAKDRSWKIPICYDDDEDNTIAITPVLPIEEPDNSLSIGDKHLDTIPEKESDKVIKSSVENLVPIPSESKDLTNTKVSVICLFVMILLLKMSLDDIVSIPPGKEIDHLDAIPDSVQSLLNRAKSIIFLIKELTGELAPIDPIPPGIFEADFVPEDDIRLIENLLNDDSSPHS